ncbi:RnfH family protein [Thiorhodovibrio winogradskyi]|nr:RnfH family protein [Thiorhodovibrio winogradskyi]
MVSDKTTTAASAGGSPDAGVTINGATINGATINGATINGVTINVEVVYARQAAQTLLNVKGAPGLTAGEAIERSGILSARPEIDLSVNKLGIFGKPIKAEQALANGDRVEIYSPLIADPKQAKQKQAASRSAKSEAAKPDAASA